MLVPLSTSLFRPLPHLTSRTLPFLLPLQHRSVSSSPPRPPGSSSSPFPTSYKPYTPKPRPPTPIKYPPSLGSRQWASSGPGSAVKVGFERVGQGGTTDGMGLGDKMRFYGKKMNKGSWAYSDKQGWKPLAFKFEVCFLIFLCWVLYKWDSAATASFAQTPINYDTEKQLADQWNKSIAQNKRYRDATTQEERELVAREQAHRMLDFTEGKFELPCYPPAPERNVYWWTWDKKSKMRDS